MLQQQLQPRTHSIGKELVSMDSTGEEQAPLRRKADRDRKTNQIRIRVTATEKQRFSEVAQRFGLDLSAWLRMLGATAVRSERLKTREACKEERVSEREAR